MNVRAVISVTNKVQVKQNLYHDTWDSVTLFEDEISNSIFVFLTFVTRYYKAEPQSSLFYSFILVSILYKFKPQMSVGLVLAWLQCYRRIETVKEMASYDEQSTCSSYRYVYFHYYCIVSKLHP